MPVNRRARIRREGGRGKQVRGVQRSGEDVRAARFEEANQVCARTVDPGDHRFVAGSGAAVMTTSSPTIRFV